MNTSTNGANAIVTANGLNLHYYRPIAGLQGQVLKYAGMASPNNLAHFPEKCMEAEDGYLPGLVILPVYVSDRIYLVNLQPYTE